MATATVLLTLEQYRAQYGSEPGWEYWFGEAVRKPAPDWLHAIFQVLMAELLYQAGYFSGSELDLHIDPAWQPRPDVAGSLELTEPFPTKPVDVVMEILSDDQMGHLFEKCAHYCRIGIGQIFVLDPKSQRTWRWHQERDTLERVQDIALNNGSVIRGDIGWQEFQQRCQKRPSGN